MGKRLKGKPKTPPRRDPTPAEIAERAAEIRKEWVGNGSPRSQAQREVIHRLGGGVTTFEVEAME